MRPLLRRLLLVSLSLLALAGCGGGGGGGGGGGLPHSSCSLADQKTWLKGYMDDWYFWYSLMPGVSAGGYASVDDYFYALRYDPTVAGNPSDVNFPYADRWSYTESTADFNRFFGDGQDLGYGLFVAGLEVAGHPELPLRVRYIEPLSPAAAAGVVRGDTIVSVNGRAASDIITADDYAWLTPASVGETIHLVLGNGGAQRSVDVSAAVYALKPLSTSGVVSTPLGRKMGYLVLKDFIGQASMPMDTAFADFKAAGVSELVVDLRYNGGGLVSVADQLASSVAGAARQGQVFASLLYNDKHQGSNATYRFGGTASDLGIGRVFVLAGRRTCSASELVVNGLRPYVNVVLIGEATCGKPVGFLPQDGGCGTTYSAVNFEAVNVNNEGRYWNGFDPTSTCSVADDLDHPLGSAGEALLAAASSFADAGSCGGTAVARETAQAVRMRGARTTEAHEHQGMIDR